MYGKIYSYSYSDIFKRVDQLKVWRWILQKPLLQLGELITSPFRADEKPGCYLRNNRGLILFTDFATPRYNKFTCVHALAELQSTTLRGASTLIGSRFIDNATFKLNSLLELKVKVGGTKSLNDGQRKDITFVPFSHQNNPAFTYLDKKYWSNRLITSSDLLSEHQPVYSIHHFYINGYKMYPDAYPCYALFFPESGHTKLYQPHAKKRKKFLASNCDKEDVWMWTGFPQSEICIITKSYKDGAILNKLFPDIDIYAFQNEGVIPEYLSVINELHDKVIILYDNDLAGILASYKLVNELEYSEPVFYPKAWGKDTDDALLKVGPEQIKKFLKQKL